MHCQFFKPKKVQICEKCLMDFKLKISSEQKRQMIFCYFFDVQYFIIFLPIFLTLWVQIDDIDSGKNALGTKR